MLNQREYKVQAVIDEIKASLGNYSRYSTTIGEVYTKKSFDDTYRSANNKLRNVARIANNYYIYMDNNIYLYINSNLKRYQYNMVFHI